jgi:Xaa-Pro dipeptidase
MVKKVVDSKSNIPIMVNYLTRMNEKKLDYLFVYFNGLHSFLEPNFVFLLSGFKSIGECLLVVEADGYSTLFVTPAWDVERAMKQSNTTKVIGTNDLVSSIREMVELKKVTNSYSGFIGLEQMTPTRFEKVSSMLNKTINDVTNHFKDFSRIKSVQEIENARKATWIAERGYEKVLEVAKPGMYDYQLAGELVSYMKSLGADDNFLLMSASQHNQAVRPPGRRRLERGDIILAEISPSYQGQFSQICRSVALGCENYELLTEKYQLLIHAMDRGFQTAKPGNKMSDIVHAINEPIMDAGYGKYCSPPYMRVRGHGLGVTSLIPGDVSQENDIILEEGMFFVIHPNQYLPETGYLLCGDPVLITGDGAENISSQKSSLGIINI